MSTPTTPHDSSAWKQLYDADKDETVMLNSLTGEKISQKEFDARVAAAAATSTTTTTSSSNNNNNTNTTSIVIKLDDEENLTTNDGDDNNKTTTRYKNKRKSLWPGRRKTEIPRPLPGTSPDNSKPVEIGSVSMRQLYRFATPFESFLLFLGIICSLASGATMSAYSQLIGTTFDQLNSPGGLPIDTILYFIYVGLGTITVGCLQVAFFTIVADRVTVRMREAYLASVLRQDVQFFDMYKAGELSSAVNENAVLFREGVGDKPSQAIMNLSMFVAGVILGLTKVWKLTLVILSVSPLLVLTALIMAKNMKRLVSGQLAAYARAGNVAEETLHLIRTVTGLGAQPKRIQIFEDELVAASVSSRKQGVLSGATTGMVMGVFFSCYGIAFWSGANFIVQSRQDAENAYPLSATVNKTAPFCIVGGHVPQQCSSSPVTAQTVFLTASDVCACYMCGCGCYPSPKIFGADAAYDCISGGDILTTFFAVLIGSFGLGQAGPALGAVNNARVAAYRIYKMIDREATIKDDDTGDKVDNMKGQVVFENVAFSYPARPDAPIYTSLNVTMEAGARTALVGPSGSGKSSAVALLLRFYDPTGGRITVDGYDLKKLNLTWWRSQLGLVSQEPTLFAASIMENVRFGFPSATDEQVIKACEEANALSFIEQFPDKFNTKVGQAGSQISGGQKQRIAIARAMIRKAKILIFDEATSALDSASEAIVNDTIEAIRAKNPITTLVIAHRLDTVRHCNKIVVLERGNVIEQGSHDQLMAMQGQYYAMVKIASGGGSHHHGPKSPTMENQQKKPATITNKEDPQFTSMTQLNQGGEFGVKVEDDDEGEQEEEDDNEVIATVEDEKQQRENTTITTTNEKSGNKKMKKKKGPKEKNIPIRRAFEFVGKDYPMFIPAIVGSAGAGLSFPLFALFFGSLLSTFYEPTSDTLLYNATLWSLAFFGLGCMNFVTNLLQSASFGFINGRMTARVRSAIFKSVLRSEVGFFDMPENSTGVLTAKIASDAALVKAAISDRIHAAVQNLSTITAGFVIAFTSSWKLALVVFGTFPIIAFSGAMQMRLMQGIIGGNNKELAAANQTVSEAVSGIRTVMAFNMKDGIQKLYKEQLLQSLRSVRKASILAGFGFGFAQSTRFFTQAITMSFGSHLMREEGLTFKDLTTAMFAILMSAIGTGQLMSGLTDISKGQGAVNSIYKVLDRVSKIDWTNSQGESPSTIMGDIEFQNVVFSYPARANVLALNGFSLKITRGKRIALVGPSGSGKSTVIQLLIRFYDADQGLTLLDGKDIRLYNISWLRSHIGLVSQEPVLFDTSILENIRYGRPEATNEEIYKACKDANAYDFIMSDFPKQFDTNCGARGGQLSGGQKQRICIARALVKNPSIMLFDEATSALDEESQRVVQVALDRLFAENSSRTTITIAHRYSTIRNVDVVVVVDKGKVIEQGGFKELQEKPNGAFAKLLRSQNVV
jgi:ABC-type multidrug transport system fused ATPase/permease subunit